MNLVLTLAYELIHALRYMRGHTKDPSMHGYYSIGLDKWIKEKQEELDTMGITYYAFDENGEIQYYPAAGWWNTENSLRRELGFSLRVSY